MRLLVQRVSKASVVVDQKEVAAIESGALVFVGITQEDTKASAIWLAHKLVALRIFVDEEGKFNRSILDTAGSILIVSQFTLYADCLEGRRPSFTKAAAPEFAKELYELFVAEVKNQGVSVQTGIFGAKMKVSIVNEGPATFFIEK